MKLSYAVGILWVVVLIGSCENAPTGSANGDDHSPPTVSSTLPPPGSTSVAVASTVSATFSESMQPGSLTRASFSLSPDVAGSVSYAGATATFTPSVALDFGTIYTATITTSARDAAGNPLEAAYSWSFTTRGSTIPSARAGSDIDVNRGQQVTLNGGLSRDPENDPLTFEWRQIAGPDVTAGSGVFTGVAPAFEAPPNVSTVALELRVADATDISEPDTIQVNVMEASGKGLFVRTDGSDDAAGTREQPMRTVAAAISRARVLGDGTDVYLAAGRFPGSLALATGVSLYGGFDPVTWMRSPELESRIEGGSTAVTGIDVDVVTLDGLTIAGANAVEAGSSAYGILLARSSMITLANSTILVGNGAAGLAGSAGVAGAAGGAGSPGRPGVESGGFLCSSGPQPLGAVGGASAFASGGRGGNAGRSTEPGAGGAAGTSGPTSAGGTGGAGAPAGRGNWSTPAIYWGADGMDGRSGPHGTGGNPFGVMTAAGYAPSGGSNGTGGTPGSGGGGGGGGGGGTSNCDSWGGSGGGGGGAGTPGGPGTAGSGGGGSFGVYLFASRDIALSNLMITTGAGGAGGEGGTGGAGGSGGEGGAFTYGGSGEQDDGSNGGRGGRGGAGGNGGAGGGGGGGPSIAILEDALSSATRNGIESTLFAAGQGGDSPGNPGANGEQVEFRKLQTVGT